MISVEMFALFLTLLLIGQIDPLERARALAQRGEIVKAIELLPPPSVNLSFEKQEYSLMANGLYLLAEIRYDMGEDTEALVRRVIELEPLHTSA